MASILVDVNVFGRQWDLHAMIAAAMLTIAGAQVIGLGLGARAYGVHHMGERDRLFERFDGRVRLEHGILLGIALFTAGFAVAATVLGVWINRGFGALSEERLAVFAATLIVVGIQIFFSSFLLSILGLRRRDSEHQQY